MQNRISEVQIIPVKPTNGLVGFASVVFDDCLYLGSIGIYTRLEGGLLKATMTDFISRSVNRLPILTLD